MARHELLSDAEREQLLGIPRNRDQLARLYTLERSDFDIIQRRREKRNRLGIALQLAMLRHPGTTLAQFLDRVPDLPEELIAFMAEQLVIAPGLLSDYASREQTMTDHARELATALGFRGPVRSDIPFMIEAAAGAAWATDSGVAIAAGVIDALRGAKILLPAISTIERAGIAGRARARKQATQALLSGLNSAQLTKLDELFSADDDAESAPLAWLKAIPMAAKPDHIKEILDRLQFVRQVGIPAKQAAMIHPDRYHQFVREGRASPAYMIERYSRARRRATLVAHLIDLEERLTDAAIEMADKLIGGVFSRAKNAQARRYVATTKDVSRLMRLFRGTIDALSMAVENNDDPIAAIDKSVGWETLLKARAEVGAVAETADEDPLILAVNRYATLRKFAPALIEALDFKAAGGNNRTVAAINILRELNKSSKRDVPADAPMPFKKEWRKLVIDADGKINRRLYETATLAHLRNKLRSGDVWVERSSSYRKFDSYLLPEKEVAPIVSALGLPATADEWLDQRGKELDWRLKKFAQRLKRNQLDGVTLVDERLQITPVRAVVPVEAEALADQLDAILPRIRITELLHEVARETGFIAAFKNLRTGEICPNESALLAAILADATNLGLSRMANASQGVTRDQLIWTMTPISERTRTTPPWPSSSTPIIASPSPRSGVMARLQAQMDNSSAAASAGQPAATSMPATALIPASASIPMSRTSTAPTTSRLSRRRRTKPPMFSTACSTTAATSKSPNITRTLAAPRTMCLHSARCLDSGFVPGCVTSQIGAWCRSICRPHILELPRCWGNASVPT